VINCGFPGYLHNGAVTGNSYLFRDIVSFSCDTGYRLQHLFMMMMMMMMIIHNPDDDDDYS